jgi:hypothetical protein
MKIRRHSLFALRVIPALMLGACATPSPFPKEAASDPSLLTDPPSFTTADSASVQGLLRGSNSLPGLKSVQVSVLPKVPRALAADVAGFLVNRKVTKDDLTASDVEFAYSTLETTFGRNKSCFLVQASASLDTWNAAKFLVYAQDANQPLQRLAIATATQQTTQDYVPTSTYTSSTMEFDPLNGKTVTVYHDNVSPGHVVSSEESSVMYCTPQKLDFSRPVDFYITSETQRNEALGIASFSWYPTGGQPLPVKLETVAEQIGKDLQAHPDFKPNLNRIDADTTKRILVSLRVADYAGALAALDFKEREATLSDRYELGALAVWEGTRGASCDTRFILDLLVRGALLSMEHFQNARAYDLQRCVALSQLRFHQLPAQREDLFIATHQQLITTIKEKIAKRLGEKDKNEISALLLLDYDMLKAFDQQCREGKDKRCPLVKRGYADMAELKAILAKSIAPGAKFVREAIDSAQLMAEKLETIGKKPHP